MKSINPAYGALTAVALLTLTGCVDDNYDLSDIDTTAQFQVVDLTLPINLDEILLENILDLDDNSSIKEVDGKYAVVESGSLSSDPLKIDVETIHGEPISVSRTEIFSFDPATANATGNSVDVHYNIEPSMSTFSYDKSDVDNNIRSISKLAVDWTLSLSVSIEDKDNLFSTINFKDVEMKLPKGLTTPDYKNVDGIINVGDFTLNSSHKSHTVDIRVTEITPSEMSADEFKFVAGQGEAGGSVSIHGEIGPYSGTVTATTSATATAPESVWMITTPTMSNIVVNEFSGNLKYTFSNFSIPSVDIENLPDVFKQSGTDVHLANPQLYLSINNPVADYALDMAAGLELTPVRNGVEGNSVTLDPGQQIEVGHNAGVDGPYTFCISPSRPDQYYQGFDGATYVGCNGLSDVLSGDGLPDAIDVDITDARVVEGHVDNFSLGSQLSAVNGSYTIYCPLDLNVNSVIVYSETKDGWSDDTVDKLQITKLKLAMDVTNDMPFDILLKAYPIGLDGQRCIDPATGNYVALESINVPANSTTSVVTSTNGTIVHLDGLYFEADATVETPNQTLTPSTPIKLTNIKVTVSGTYTDEL
jgi:hypothetical protein